MKNKDLKITIGWLYPDLMSTYGDRGNILILKARCEWREIQVEIKHLLIDSPADDLRECDLFFMGGAQDRQQKIVSDDLRKKSVLLKHMADKGTPGLYICGAFQFLGKYYKDADGTEIEGLGILDLITLSPGKEDKRLTGNVITRIDENYLYNTEFSKFIVGFENHGGRSFLGHETKSFGRVFKGYGNNGKDGTEGAVYMNTFGTYLHGPLLSKNPHFADYLISKALEIKYKRQINLKPLDDSLEKKAHIFIANRLGVEI